MAGHITCDLRVRARAFLLVIERAANLRSPHGPCLPSDTQLSARPDDYAELCCSPAADGEGDAVVGGEVAVLDEGDPAAALQDGLDNLVPKA